MRSSVKITSGNISGKSVLIGGVRIIPLVSTQVISGNSFVHADVSPEFLLFAVQGKYYYFDLGGNCGDIDDKCLNDFILSAGSSSPDKKPGDE
ncbi:hypothetical protein [Methanoplanus endosymbiosus]|uniref:Uncharacterized protein n=1 Tax=Methanoplanus endosymbiosus TaxID=33865 RepID=A0A9E7PTQ5_9EURY|nr:hypothetical protein [Methanoplanus endosymbiosus]UUX93787.1 hypothetical protein L6E24_06650 [Methanoplanus endosymbiosus]